MLETILKAGKNNLFGYIHRNDLQMKDNNRWKLFRYYLKILLRNKQSKSKQWWIFCFNKTVLQIVCIINLKLIWILIHYLPVHKNVKNELKRLKRNFLSKEETNKHIKVNVLQSEKRKKNIRKYLQV